MLMQEFEGKNRDEAVKNALDALGLKEDQVTIEYIDDGKAGFFGFRGGRPARIKVYYEQVESEFSKKTCDLTKKILEMMEIGATVEEVKEDDEILLIRINSKSSGLIIGKKGRNLEALQFLINVIANKNKENSKKILLDIEGYRSKKEEAIRRLALRTANIVRKTRKAKLLEPMNPFERRLVHITLQNFSDIETKSEGEGIYKKVKIFLK
jgi:spoIIIJ-associated protein